MDKKTTQNKDENINILDILLDEEYSEPITLYNDEDKPVKFEQIAIIPLDDKLYAILKPIDTLDGVADDEALVFLINDNAENGDAELIVEIDEQVLIKVFDVYYKLLEDSNIKPDKDNK